MKQSIILLFSLVTIGSLLGCSGQQAESSTSSTTVGSTTTTAIRTEAIKEDGSDVAESERSTQSTAVSTYEFFESDETIDSFFVDYNKIAAIQFDADSIERGNIKTKALVYIDDFFCEVVNAKGSLSVSIGSDPENEETMLYPAFRDIFLSARPAVSEEEVVSAWESIRESGYLVEGYEFLDCTITYVPSKKLSYGLSDPRIDITIPLK